MSDKYVHITLTNGELLLKPSTGDWLLCKKGQRCALSMVSRPLQMGREFPLKTLQLQLTHRCILRCVYCAVDASVAYKGHLPMETIRSLYTQALDLGLQRLSLTGGEIFLYPDLRPLLKWLMQVGKRGTHVAITTSGSIPIHDDILSLLKEIPNLTIAVSLDSYKPEVNEKTRPGVPTHRIIRTLLEMVSAGLDVSINTVLTKANYRPGFIDDFLNWSIKHGVGRQQFIFMLPSGRGRDHEFIMLSSRESEKARLEVVEAGVKYWNKIQVSDFLEMLSRCVHKQEFCGIGRDRLVVYPNGDVYPCPFLTSPEFLVGNIYHTTLEKIWMGSDRIKYYRTLSVDDIADCNSCELRYLCGGGCRAVAFYVNGNFLAKPDRCPKEAILSLLDKTPLLISKIRKPGEI